MSKIIFIRPTRAEQLRNSITNNLQISKINNQPPSKYRTKQNVRSLRQTITTMRTTSQWISWSGKATIAKTIEAKLDHSRPPFRLIDNHLLIDPVVTIEPVRNKAHYALRKKFRKVVYDGSSHHA
jgi:hypothetical protein